MPEAPAWKFRKIIKPLFDLQKENIIFKCRVIETKSLDSNRKWICRNR